ncbi:DNA polymerase I [Marinicella sp. W31]|uniref:DNA polymerase I n=1 Tax=Marinicella sp. W31 TaxID=3023713 RepID=UPI00375687FB
MTNRTLYLVDGSSYLFRAFFVPNLRRLSSKDGHPTGVMYGVSNMVQRMLDEYQPHYMAVIFDAKGKTFRHRMYEQYKANRPPMPEELGMQIQPTKDIIKAMGIPLLEVPDVEADDVIGTLARRAEAEGISTLISTSDKDLAQLVSDRITLVDTMRDATLDIAGVQEKFGVSPEQMIDYLALVGDSSDNIPGVEKVGPKTAVKWLQQYQSVDNIIKNADAFGGKVGENLRKGIEQLHLSRELATIKIDVEVDHSHEDFLIQPRDVVGLNQIGEIYDMRRFRDLEADNSEPPAPVKKIEYATIQDEAVLSQWLEKLKQAKTVAFDLETDSINPIGANIIGMSFACEAEEAAYIPIAHDTEEPQLELQQVLSKLIPVLEETVLIGQHFKYDLNVLSNYDVSLTALRFDTMLESYVLNSTASRHDMDSLADFYLDKKTTKYEEICGKGAKQIPFAQVSIKDAAHYAAEDADITWQLHQRLWSELSQAQGQAKVFQEIEMPLVSVLAKMEQTGVLLDVETLENHSAELAEKMAATERKAFDLAGKEFNLNSPKQLREILFEEQKIPSSKKTATGQFSTSEEVLQDLSHEHELPALILEYRSLSKIKNTYTDKLPLEIHADTSRVHTSYHQAVASTGRLSSNNPNLQNIPIRTAEGRKVRKAFVAPPGWKIMAADYSQIELRIMAHLSQDDNLLKAFKHDLDVHSQTASQVFGEDLEKVSREQRRAAKAINFGLMYGMSAFGLSKQLGIARREASNYIKQYFNQYPKVEAFMQRIREQASDQLYLDTVFERRLFFPNINDRNMRVRSGAERAAINAPMQGTAADIIKMAMIRVFDHIQARDDIRVIMQVHDELVFEVKADVAEVLAQEIQEIMEKVAELDVPLKVDYGIGENWEEAH